ncbi:TPA: D-alanyl-D-alanine carboxypeptidase family protein [Streptococcus suis]
MSTPVFIKKTLIATLSLTLTTVPVSTFAQVSKVPVLTGEMPVIPETDPFVMPDDYPQALVEHFEANMDARSYVVIDSQTNRVLAERQGNTRYPIASMSKVAAMYLIYQALEEGTIKLDQEIEVPQIIEDTMSFNFDMSAMGLYADTKYTVEELMYGIMLLSGNDATSTLMWHLYGDEQTAVKAIRDLLTSWGISNFEFYTTSGIPNQYLPESMWIDGSNATSENQMTAADVAYMAQKTITDFPQILEISSANSFIAREGTDREIIMYNPNLLLPGAEYGREGITGLKSGTTDAAGKNFVATGQENGRPIVAVAMGVFDREDLTLSPFWEIEILLDKLAEFPDLYNNSNLPTNIPQAPLEEETTEETMQETLAPEVQEQLPTENRRDNPITNFMKGIFDIFK